MSRRNTEAQASYIRASCRLCGAERLEELLRLAPTPLANCYPRQPEEGATQEKFPLYLVGCQACGHVQLPVVVDPRRLFPPDYPYQSGTSPVFREHLRALALALEELARPHTALDIACNDGTLVREMRARGITAVGIDPAAPAPGPEEPAMFHRCFFTEDWANGHKNERGVAYDVITALNVFAHVADLDDFVRGVKRLLAPCGLFVIECAYLPDMVERQIWDTIYHEHLGFFHLWPLRAFFERHGMRMVDAHRIDTQGGSVRIFVRNCTGQHVGGDDGHELETPRLKELLGEECKPERAGVWQGVRKLKASMARERKRVLSFARKHKLSGKPIAIYGAPAKLTTYLAGTGLFPDRVGLVVEDNPLKVGRYVPGTRLRIEPTSELKEYHPTGVLCAAWNFADDIRARWAELGAEWCVPFSRYVPEMCALGHELDEHGYCEKCDVTVSYR